MEKQMRIWGMIAGGLLVVAACCPVLAKNGVSVNAFQANLGLKAGIFLVPAALAIGGLSWMQQRWALRLSVFLAVLVLGVAFNYWWQGRHLGAVSWGTWLLLLTALHACVFTLVRVLRQPPANI